MKKRKSLIAAVLLITFVLSACSAKENGNKGQQTDTNDKTETPAKEKREKEKKYQKKLDAIKLLAYRNADGLKLEPGAYLSVIGKNADGEYWEEVKRGAEQAVADINEELGYKGKDEVKVTYSGPSVQDSVDEQVNILDEELARYPVALSISIVDAQACGVQFDLAAESGIPVVAFDSGSDYQGLMATVSTDNRGTAAEAADRMAEAIGGAGEIAVFVQDSKSKSAEERETGFVERMQEMYPDISIAEIYHLDQKEEMQRKITGEEGAEEESENAGDTEPEDVEPEDMEAGDTEPEDMESEEVQPEEISEEEIMDYIFEEHPNLKGCFATSGDGVALLINTVERLEKEELTIIGYDADEEELEALENGRVAGLMVQNPFGMGYASVIASARAALSMGNEAYVDTGAVWVTRENLDSEEVQKMLY